MNYQYLTNTPLKKAVQDYIKLLEDNNMQTKEETVKVFEACKRTTSKAVYAKICAPHYNACAMDGIALKASLTFGATETSPVTISKADYIVVDTGDPLPKDADCVVMVEDVVEKDDNYVELYTSAVPWQHVRQIGEDICAGDMILPSYTEITPSAIGAMLAGGVLEVDVVKRPVVGIIPTGDEIVQPTDSPNEGDIIEFNSSIFSGILESYGAIPKTYAIVKDKKDLIINAVQTAVDECDVVILNAGSSAGREDFSTLAIDTVGSVLYHGIAIKPGKPAILGHCKEKPILGVPGYPVSGIIVLEQILKPVLEKMMKKSLKTGEQISAKTSRQMTSPLKYQEFVRTRVGANENGEFVAVPLSRGAGVVTSFVKADGIIDVPQNCEGYNAGDDIKVDLLRDKQEILNTITVIGSHDPLIDEATDILKRKFDNTYVSSSHVGSMGGIMAIKRKEAEIAGVHLLDENTGEYNKSYMQKYFKDGSVVLLRGVKRIQGIMVEKGNPKNIKGFKDLIRDDISYVNRQRGSGTRILCDYMCKTNGVSPTDIYGYEREEFTHTAVAAQIASKTADAGLGIYSAAKTYDLDFIPVCDEEYDLLISKVALESEKVQNFIKTIKSDEFKERLEKLGGYNVENVGEVKGEF